MIGYTMLGTNDFDKAVVFYDGLFSALAGKRCYETHSFMAWGAIEGGPDFSIVRQPENGKKATSGNGTMIALKGKDNKMVDAVYAKAIKLGAICEGKPGFRGSKFYAAYFRDLDGNKLNCFHTAK